MLGGVRLWLTGAALVALVAAALWLRADARGDLIDEIEGQNNEAGIAADATDIDYLECVDVGGVFWDFAAGVCRRFEAGNR